MADSEDITDFFGTPIGRVRRDGDKSEVTDFFGTPLGTADKTGTRDFLGTPISPNNVPGLLFSPKHNPMLREVEERKAKEEAARLKKEQEEQEERARAKRREYEKQQQDLEDHLRNIRDGYSVGGETLEQRERREEQERRNTRDRNFCPPDW